MSNKANYMVIHECSGCIIIQDLGPWDIFKTVTNAAEEVVRELQFFRQLNNKRLFYKDSEGHKDEILHDGQGNFMGFKSGWEK